MPVWVATVPAKHRHHTERETKTGTEGRAKERGSTVAYIFRHTVENMSNTNI